MNDREKCIKGLHDISGFVAGRMGIEQARNFLRTIDDTLSLLKEQPEIVRCKDCEYAPGNEWGFVCKIRDHFGAFMHDPDNFYCASGKNKGT